MKKEYKGFEIEIKKEKSMSGIEIIYFSITRISDGFECMSSFEESEETIMSMFRNLKFRIDEELTSRDPWGECRNDEFERNHIFFNI